MKNHSIPWRLLLEKIPLLALSGAACVVTMVAQKNSIAPVPFASRIGNAVVSYVVYLRQMFCPTGLAVFYPYLRNSLSWREITLAVVLLVAVSTSAFLVRRPRPYLLAGWLWYLGMLVPVIGLVQVGLQAQADRYTYLPQIGLYFALTWLVAEWSANWRHRRWVLGGLAAMVIAGLSFCACRQTSYWKNSKSLWIHSLAVTADNYIAHISLGEVLVEAGQVDEAIAQFQQALEIQPNYVDAHNNLGMALAQKGLLDEAIAQFRKTLEVQPDCLMAYNNLGIALAQKGLADEAMVQFRKALEIQPDYASAHYNLGMALAQKGLADEAIAQFKETLRFKPDDANAKEWLRRLGVPVPE